VWTAAGPFTATAAVHTEVTADATRELLGQLERIRDEPPNETELAEVRDFIVGVFPLRFETTAGIAAAIEPLAVYELPDDYWQTYRQNVESVTADDVRSVALDLVRPDDALILMAGDASRIRDDVERAEIGPVEVLPAP
jgi:zinc protease